MILEVAVLEVIPGRELEFESAFTQYDPFPTVEHFTAVPDVP
jgi:hypothetical protein